MGVLDNIFLGFSVALQPINLFYCFMGCLAGTLVGVLPGIGPAGAIALLLPITFRAEAVSGIIMLTAIYYGAQYGGSTTSILVNIPGEASSVVTCLDGYQMARQGRAGPALGISAIGSFIAGTFSVILLTFMAPLLANIALDFGPPEYFGLMVLGMVMVTFLASGSMLKAIVTLFAGVIFSSVGLDVVSGSQRLTFRIQELFDGFGLIPVVMGLFGISEILINIERGIRRDIYKQKIENLLPTVKDWGACKWSIVRGSLIGFFFGILPGGGAILSSFASYAVERKLSRHPEKFGTGMIEGVAAPEAANNSATGGAMVPMLTLGIPPNAVLAMLLGALMIHGTPPGPLMMTKHPQLFWGIITSMYLGNAMCLVLNLPLIGIWVKVLKIPYKILFPLILLFCLIGSYTLNNSVVDMVTMMIFGIFGYFLRKYGYESAPLALSFVLGPLMEMSLRQSLRMSDGSFRIFLMSPIAATCLLIAMMLLLFPLIPFFRKKRKDMIQVEEERQ
jgi:putative tricarboxylic transport membrane protein